MNTTRKNEARNQHNPLVRFMRGLGDVYNDYNELRAEARRRFPDTFR
ncbi:MULTISPECIES: hypothetical protein [unclassified Martelella]|nr:hypothetical protein [Martelella sp.]|tara:strand:- start:1296 stop:1436 length:141 start_codon:yes stop_codon:yes gene_type:complete